jgi:hypothetical protein
MKILLILILLLGSLEIHSEELKDKKTLFGLYLEYKTQLVNNKSDNKLSIINVEDLNDKYIYRLLLANLYIKSPLRVINCKKSCDAFIQEYKDINISLVIVRPDMNNSSETMIVQNNK